VLRKLLEWNRRRREWNAAHSIAWRGASDPGVDRLSPFQRQCEAELSRALATLSLILVDRVVETPRGNEYIRATIGGTSVCVRIHDDTTFVVASTESRRFEHWDYATPRDLIDDFCNDVLKFVRVAV
jgi:hypothetical protein